MFIPERIYTPLLCGLETNCRIFAGTHKKKFLLNILDGLPEGFLFTHGSEYVSFRPLIDKVNISSSPYSYRLD